MGRDALTACKAYAAHAELARAAHHEAHRTPPVADAKCLETVALPTVGAPVAQPRAAVADRRRRLRRLAPRNLGRRLARGLRDALALPGA
jgi:hypothetical protein